MSTKKGRYGSPRNRQPVYGDLARMRQPTGIANPRKLGGSIVGGDPHTRYSAVLDMADCVLLDHTECCIVEVGRDGQIGERAIFMTLGGRVNKTDDRTQVGYMLNTDGAAALITELLALADRAGADMLDDVTRRLKALYRGKAVDLAWLRAALDNALDDA